MSRAELERILSKLVELHNEKVKLNTLLRDLESEIVKREQDKNLISVPLHLLDFACSLGISEEKMYQLDPSNGYTLEKTDNLEEQIQNLVLKIKQTNESKPKLFQNKKDFEANKAREIETYNKEIDKLIEKIEQIKQINKDKIEEHDSKSEQFNRINKTHRMNLIRHKMNTTQAIYQLEVLYNSKADANLKLANINNEIKETEERLNKDKGSTQLLDKYNNIVQLTKLLEFVRAESADNLKEAYFMFDINPCWDKIELLDEDILKSINSRLHNLLYKNMNGIYYDERNLFHNIADEARNNVMKNTSLAELEIVQYWKNEELKSKLTESEIKYYKNYIWTK